MGENWIPILENSPGYSETPKTLEELSFPELGFSNSQILLKKHQQNPQIQYLDGWYANEEAYIRFYDPAGIPAGSFNHYSFALLWKGENSHRAPLYELSFLGCADKRFRDYVSFESARIRAYSNGYQY